MKKYYKINSLERKRERKKYIKDTLSNETKERSYVRILKSEIKKSSAKVISRYEIQAIANTAMPSGPRPPRKRKKVIEIL